MVALAVPGWPQTSPEQVYSMPEVEGAVSALVRLLWAAHLSVALVVLVPVLAETLWQTVVLVAAEVETILAE
jgi:hypothetical protein